ncbi:short-chain dehydrogenase [Trichodelitschia bisporula]|uniref:Short-chain dehydrogenase n=1 Tax=Trichodelitschia bisporula TaxID=703511 RepID=A0A6G1I796_9PEZI|nr:short-chain dehydrogenase [Trichodelitschia bisporula]
MPEPEISEKNTPDQTGRVHFVTGGYTGVGLALCHMLYAANAKIYIAGRSEAKANKAISELRAAHPDSKGTLTFISVDLSDLRTIAPAVKSFTDQESDLHVLTNNAGVMVPPKGSVGAQGKELQLQTNCLGPFLLTELLLPTLKHTAAKSPKGTVRVTWAASLTQLFSPPGGVTFTSGPDPEPVVPDVKHVAYAMSKAANILLAAALAQRVSKDGIISLSFNPGNLDSELQRHVPMWQKLITGWWLLFPVRYGGCTELWAALGDVPEEKNGSYVAPWGQLATPRMDIVPSMRSKEDGGNGRADEFWEWCERTTAPFRDVSTSSS